MPDADEVKVNPLVEEAKAKLAAKQAGEASQTTKHPNSKTYYARLNGCKYVFKDGNVAQFVNGEYVTDRLKEIEELDEVLTLSSNHLICATRVPLQNAEGMVVARDVSQGPNTGVLNSGHLARAGMTRG
jgi:hypothetical protein